jgi:retron-type reverse transcriptase
MKRHRDLWPRLISFPNLLRAAVLAGRGKRHLANVARFHFDLEKHLCRLQDDLRTRTFEIYEPKRRLISAAPFRDRVVHHALCRVLQPVFEPTFIFDSYACRKGKGTHAAVDRFSTFARRNRYVLKCDVSKYFPSIDLEILEELITRKVKDRDVLWLVHLLIDHSNPQEPVQEWYRGDDLFTPTEGRRGLPLGNQTSQFFANVYLNPFDHWVKQRLRARCYIRYVDDFVVFSDDKGWLAEARQRCRERLDGLRLRLHPHKSVISRVQGGTRFLGYRVFPGHRLVPRENVTRMKRRLKRMQAGYARGELSLPDVQRRLAAWLGHALHADTFGLRLWLFQGLKFRRRAE